MTTPPKARRFHIDRIGTGRDEGAEPPADAATAPFSASQITVAVRKKTAESAAIDGAATEDATSEKPEPGRIPSAETLMQTTPDDDEFGDRRFPTAGPAPRDDDPAAEPGNRSPAGATASPANDNEDLEKKLAAIRAENLTIRQLRIARRIAALHQIEVEIG